MRYFIHIQGLPVYTSRKKHTLLYMLCKCACVWNEYLMTSCALYNAIPSVKHLLCSLLWQGHSLIRAFAGVRNDNRLALLMLANAVTVTSLLRVALRQHLNVTVFPYNILRSLYAIKPAAGPSLVNLHHTSWLAIFPYNKRNTTGFHSLIGTAS